MIEFQSYIKFTDGVVRDGNIQSVVAVTSICFNTIGASIVGPVKRDHVVFNRHIKRRGKRYSQGAQECRFQHRRAWTSGVIRGWHCIGWIRSNDAKSRHPYFFDGNGVAENLRGAINVINAHMPLTNGVVSDCHIRIEIENTGRHPFGCCIGIIVGNARNGVVGNGASNEVAPGLDAILRGDVGCARAGNLVVQNGDFHWGGTTGVERHCILLETENGIVGNGNGAHCSIIIVGIYCYPVLATAERCILNIPHRAVLQCSTGVAEGNAHKFIVAIAPPGTINGESVDGGIICIFHTHNGMSIVTGGETWINCWR